MAQFMDMHSGSGGAAGDGLGEAAKLDLAIEAVGQAAGRTHH
jgi:hypothetical protein